MSEQCVVGSLEVDEVDGVAAPVVLGSVDVTAEHHRVVPIAEQRLDLHDEQVELCVR